MRRQLRCCMEGGPASVVCQAYRLTRRQPARRMRVAAVEYSKTTSGAQTKRPGAARPVRDFALRRVLTGHSFPVCELLSCGARPKTAQPTTLHDPEYWRCS